MEVKWNYFEVSYQQTVLLLPFKAKQETCQEHADYECFFFFNSNIICITPKKYK